MEPRDRFEVGGSPHGIVAVMAERQDFRGLAASAVPKKLGRYAAGLLRVFAGRMALGVGRPELPLRPCMRLSVPCGTPPEFRFRFVSTIR